MRGSRFFNSKLETRNPKQIENIMKEGFAGRIAEFFMNSKLTILLMIALMIIGVYSSTLIPREEEPQIIVPMADVMVGLSLIHI